MESGAPDLRYSRHPYESDVRDFDATAPVVGRLEAFGAQGGEKGGPYFAGGSSSALPGSPFNYTQGPREARSRGGTAPGGLVLLPPELDLSSIDDDLAPGGVTLSTTTLLAATGTRFGAGLPELAAGTVKDGYVWEAISGELRFSALDADGDVDEQTNFRNLGEVVMKASAFGAGDLNDVTDTTKQKQIGVRVDGGNEAFAVNIGGTIFTVPAAT
jgi:hypothetical protein